MGKVVSRPKNEDIGKPLRDKRIPVQVSQDEYDTLSGAADAAGVPLSTWLRWLALKAAKAQ